MFWIAIATIVVAGYYFDLQKLKLKQEKRGGANTKHVSAQVDRLTAENELLKDRLQHLERTVLDKKTYIDVNLDDYEAEQIRVDQAKKKFNDGGFNYD